MAQAAQRKPVQSADTDFSQLFKDFHSRHRDADGNKLKFTAFFNGLLEALIGNPELQLWMRAIIWVVRYSWGNDVDFAVSQIKGPPVHQQDFAQRIGIDKRRASEVFAEAEAKGYLTSKGNLLYPVDQPTQTAKSNKKPQKSDEGALFPDFDSPFLRWCEEEWKTMSSADFQALQDAEATVRRIRLVRLGLWRKAKKARTSGGPIIIDKTSITIKSTSSSVSADLSTEAVPEEPTTTTSPIETPQETPEPTQEAQFHEEVTQSFAGKGSPTPEQLRKAYAAVPHAAPVETFVTYLKGRMPKLQHPGGLQSVAQEFAREWSTCGGTAEAWNALRLARGPLTGLALMMEKAKSGGAS